MAAKAFYLPWRPAIDANGLTVPGAQLYFYATGTTTPQAIYSDTGLTTPLTNPVEANSAGRWPTIYLNDALTYRVVLKDGDGVTLADQDPYLADVADAVTSSLTAVANAVAANASTASSAAATATTQAGYATSNATAAAASAASALNAPGTSATSTTSLTIGTGSKSLTLAQADKAFALGQFVMIASTASPTNYMIGQITAFTGSTGAMTVTVTQTGGSGTISAWTVSLSSAGGITASSTDTLTNKTIDLASNALTGTLAQFNTACSDADFVDTASLAASGGAALAGFLQAGTSAVARTVQAKLRDGINVMDFGAVGDGTTNDYAAFAAADAAAASLGLPLVISKTHRLNTSYTTTATIVWAGGKIKPASGTTATIGAGIDAPAVQVFDTSLGGTIAFNTRFTPWGWAEWWGLTAESSGSAAANVAAINAAITALRETCLQARTYYTNAQISLTVAGKRLRGSGYQYDGSTEGRVTRIICTSATAHILYMGDTLFTSIANLPRGIYASDLFLTRSVGPDVTSGCSGVLAKWSLFSGMERIKTDNCVYGFQFGGNVHFKGIDLHTTRSTAGTGGADIFYGYFADGSINIGANGGNASLYLIRCNAEGGITISNSVGFYANQKMTDLFIHYPETSNFTTGIELYGPATNTTLNYDTIDVEILAPKLDTFTFAGIYIHGMNKYGSVEIKGGYYGAANGATASINVVDNLAAVRIDGGQFLMGVVTTTFGIRIATSSNVEINGSQINEATADAVVLDVSTNCRVMPFVKNHSKTCASAVKMINACTACYVAPMVSGAANKVSCGIQVTGTTDARNEYNCTGIDSACINTGSGNKLVRNAVQVTATGLSGTNLVSGVMT